MAAFSHSHLQKSFSQKNFVQKRKNEKPGFHIKIAKNGLKIDEKCQKMSNHFHFPIFFQPKSTQKKPKRSFFKISK